MRVIAGSARRISLKTMDGKNTRPTTDRIKETLFNMIQYDLADCLFLDLFSGSGAIGIEALSRGARQAVFVEHHAGAAACIRDNLIATGLEDQAILMNCDVLTALNRLEGKNGCFDFVFMDPPYGSDWERQVLAALRRSALINPDTTLIIEVSIEAESAYLSELGFEIIKIKKYRTNQHLFVRLTRQGLEPEE